MLLSPDSSEAELSTLSKPNLGYWLPTETEQFSSALEDIAAAQEITIDAERASGFRYGNAAYLVQVGIAATANVIFDPVALTEVEDWNTRLAAVLNNKNWILHAATQDLPCLGELGLVPFTLFDTELAARLCSFKRFGLAALAEELLGYRIAKEHSAADWSLRPLSENMLSYAAIDVEVLFGIREALDSRLVELGRQDWALQEFQHLLGFQPKAAASNGWRKMSGAGSLKLLRQQQIAASLWLARDSRARERDVAPGRLIPDAAIVAAASKMPASIAQLKETTGFSGRESRSQIQRWWQAIEAATSLAIEPIPAAEIPPHRSWERKFPDAWQRYQALRVALQPLIAQLDIPAENLISPSIVRQIAWHPIAVEEQLADSAARAWQIELVAEPLSDALRQLT